MRAPYVKAPRDGKPQTTEAVPRMKWKTMETTASISSMWIKNAVTWNMKKPPSHSKSKTNPRARNIVRLFLPKMSNAFRVCDPIDCL
jgi:hypothetical protein